MTLAPIPTVPGAVGAVIPLDGGHLGVIVSAGTASIVISGSPHRVQCAASAQALRDAAAALLAAAEAIGIGQSRRKLDSTATGGALSR